MGVAVGVSVSVAADVGVFEGGDVGVSVGVDVGVIVAVGVGEFVGFGVCVGFWVGCACGLLEFVEDGAAGVMIGMLDRELWE